MYHAGIFLHFFHSYLLLPLPPYSDTPCSVRLSSILFANPYTTQRRWKEKNTKRDVKRGVSPDHSRLRPWLWRGFTASYAKNISQPWSLLVRIICSGLPPRPSALEFCDSSHKSAVPWSNGMRHGRDASMTCDLSRTIYFCVSLLPWDQKTRTSQKKRVLIKREDVIAKNVGEKYSETSLENSPKFGLQSFRKAPVTLWLFK